MSNSIRKVIYTEDIGYGSQRNAWYFHSAHASNTFHLYHRTDIDKENSPLVYVLSTGTDSIDSLFMAMGATALPTLEAEEAMPELADRDWIRQWEWFAIRHLKIPHTPEGMNKEQAMKLMPPKKPK